MKRALQKQWFDELEECLSSAAKLCVDHEIDVESFMRGAWSAYVEARPGLRDHIEEMQLREQLDEIRKTGRMSQA